MASERSVFEPELGTYPQAPTSRTSVETSGEANASSSGAGIPAGIPEGGSGGKPSGPVDSAWARALVSVEACKRGVCAYKNPDAPRDGRAAAHGCDGYHASRG